MIWWSQNLMKVLTCIAFYLYPSWPFDKGILLFYRVCLESSRSKRSAFPCLIWQDHLRGSAEKCCLRVVCTWVVALHNSHSNLEWKKCFVNRFMSISRNKPAIIFFEFQTYLCRCPDTFWITQTRRFKRESPTLNEFDFVRLSDWIRAGQSNILSRLNQ